MVIGFMLITLIALAIIIPNLYEDELKAILIEQVSKRIKAKLGFEDLDLSLLSSFPDFQLRLSEPRLTGIEEFAGLNLFEAEDLKLDLDFGSLIRDRKNIIINEIRSDNPIVKLFTNVDGKSNWDIAIDGDTSSTHDTIEEFNLRIDHIRFRGGYFDYTDVPNKSKITLEEIDLSSKGNFNPEGFEMDTKLESPSISVSQNGLVYINGAEGIGDLTLQVHLKENKFEVDRGSFSLNALPLFLDGFLDVNPTDMDMDLTFKAASSEVKHFVSLLPNAYTSSFRDIQSAGLLTLEGSLRGTFDALRKKYPRFKIGLKIDNGLIKFPDLPLPITDINTSILAESLDDRFNQIKIDATQFALQIDDQPVEGNLSYLRSPENSWYAGSLKSDMKLQSLAQAYPMPQFETLSGNLTADIQYRFTEEQIRNEDYRDVEFTGEAEIRNVQADLVRYPNVAIDRVYLSSSPDQVNTQVNNLIMGKSQITSANLDISNPLAIVVEDESVNLQGNISGTQIFADEWMPTDTVSDQSPDDSVAVAIPEYLTGDLQFDLDELHVADYEIKDFEGNLGYETNKIALKNINGYIKNSDFTINGTIDRISEWLANRDKLFGELDLKSDKLIIDEILPESDDGPVSNDTLDLKPVVKVLPADMEFTIRPVIHHLSFKDATWTEVRGQVNLVDRALELHDMTSRLFGGTMNFEGIYDEQPDNPYFSLKYDASKLRFQQMFESFTIMKKLAPIARFIDGIFNTNLVLEGELSDGYLPVWDKLKAAGFLETLEGVVDGFKPLQEVADKLQIKAFEKSSLKDSKNWFEVIDGKVAVKEFTRKLDDIDLRISGNHAIDNELDYHILAAIPREKFNRIPAGQEVNRGLEWVNREASRLGLDLNAGDFVNVRILMTGHIVNPKVTIQLVDVSGKSLQESVRDKVIEEATEFKDSVQRQAEEKVEEVKDTITAKVEEEIEQAEKRIESEAKKITDTIRARAEEQAKDILDSAGQEIIGGVLDSLVTQEQKEKAEDVLEKEVDKVKDILKDWNPFKKKTSPDTAKKDTTKKGVNR